MPDVLRSLDLFAGVGGIRRGFELAADDTATKVETVFASEIDKFAVQAYEANHPDTVQPHGDITDLDVQSALPDHVDLLLAGFPCQPFSLAGVSKKNSLGRQHGFKDPRSGKLFWTLLDVLDLTEPTAFLFENVKNLRSHDRGRTLAIMLEELDACGYEVTTNVIDAAAVVPQHRERLYFVGYRKDVGLVSRLPELSDSGQRLRSILHEYREDPDEEDLAMRQDGALDRYTLSDALMRSLDRHKRRQASRGNGFGYKIADIDGVSRTISARYHKDGAEILIPQPGRNPRRLTPREATRLQGWTDFKIVCSDTQTYRQMGNGVAVPVISEIARLMLADLASV